jgi:RNA polymerase sigma-70 factor (ECF subfamily)
MIEVFEQSRGLDAELLEGLRRGEPRAFDALFERHWSAVYGVLFRLTGTREEAEDLAQEVFLKLYQRAPGGGEANVGGWLYRVATNLGYNALRARRRRGDREARVAELEPVSDAADSSDSPLAAVIAAETRLAVREVLAALPERQQAILILRHQGLSYAEVATALGVAPGSVGTLLARAEREFKRRYMEHCGGL